MRINEVISPLKKFIATVNVKGIQARTIIDSESESQAKLLLGRLYGEKNVVSITLIKLHEQASVPAISSEVKHENAVKYLTNKITQISNRPRFTLNDFKKAVERYKSNLKRANLEIDKRQALQQMRSSKNI